MDRKEIIQFALIVGLLMVLVLFLNTKTAHADQTKNGEFIQDHRKYLELWPVQFKNKNDAQYIASGLQNGQVFHDQDTKLYQVLYGNVEITETVVISSFKQE